jgi:hypothetical protein
VARFKGADVGRKRKSTRGTWGFVDGGNLGRLFGVGKM